MDDRAEAIDILTRMSTNHFYGHREQEAFKLAVEALSAQPECPEQPEYAKEYCAECDHIEMCRWYPYEGCEFRSLPSAERWIPVTERLPDINYHYTSDVCLVYCDNGAYAFAEFEENIFGQVGWDCEREDDYHEAVGTVVAWMPLPDPYKEGDVNA